ncbi:MAG: hypothetical protein HRT81_06705 [Henriciella sp.]|nr:hypothetical protein [Henriciella sp.]
MRNGKISLAIIVALAVQAASTLIWAGAAAERIDALERQMADHRPTAERLARLETRLDAVQAQLARIESKVDAL